MACFPSVSGINRRLHLLIQHKLTTLVDALPCAKFEFNQPDQFQFSVFTVDDIATMFAQIPCGDSPAVM